MTPEQLEAIEGIGPKTVEKISLAVNNYFASLDAGAAPAEVPAEESAGETVSEEAAAEEGAADAAQETQSETGEAESKPAEDEHEPDGSAPKTTE
jgi:N utilization substance protein A